jgi:hypothetical protein
MENMERNSSCNVSGICNPDSYVNFPSLAAGVYSYEGIGEEKTTLADQMHCYCGVYLGLLIEEDIGGDDGRRILLEFLNQPTGTFKGGGLRFEGPWCILQ